MSNYSIDDIDALLPQTQCGLCEYGACRPYATAIVEQQESIDRCPPGGERVLKALAELTGQAAEPYLATIREKAKAPSIVSIREDECIGCTKCIQACPVDAIIGSKKKMHSVISTQCTGCDLCIPPCPMDCIDTHPITLSEQAREQKANQSRMLYQARQQRLQQHKPKAPSDLSIDAKRAEIAAALLRKRNQE